MLPAHPARLVEPGPQQFARPVAPHLEVVRRDVEPLRRGPGILVAEVGGEHESAEGYQVAFDQLEFEAGRAFRRCSV